MSCARPRGLLIQSYALLVLLSAFVSVNVHAAVGDVTTIAGGGASTADGVAPTTASLSSVHGLYVAPNGDIYFTLENGHKVRKISGGVVTTIAGTGTAGQTGDGGPATSATLSYPVGVWGDVAGNIYISEYSPGRVRKVDTSGNISTVAGGGATSLTTTPIPAASSALSSLGDLVVAPNGNIFLAVYGNSTLVRIDTSGNIAVRAYQSGGLGISSSPSGLIYNAGTHPGSTGPTSGHRIRAWDDTTETMTVIAGTGTNLYSGDDGDALLAEMKPQDTVLSGDGTLFIGDRFNNRIRKVVTGIITNVATITDPKGMAALGNNLLIASGDGTIKSIEGVLAPFPPSFTSVAPNNVGRSSSVTLTVSGSSLGGVTNLRIHRTTPSPAEFDVAVTTATAGTVTATLNLAALGPDWDGPQQLHYSTDSGSSYTDTGLTLALTAPPVIGGQLYAQGGPITVTVLPSSAGYDSELWLFAPVVQNLGVTNRDGGTTVSVGTFDAGTELVFGIKVDVDWAPRIDTFKMGPGSRNPDSAVHAAVRFLNATTAEVGFEDELNASSPDYDDNVFRFNGALTADPPPSFTLITPNSAHRGETVSVTITGSNLSEVTGIQLFNSVLEESVSGVNVDATASSITVDFNLASLSADWEGERSVDYTIGAGDETITGLTFTIQPPIPVHQQWQGTLRLVGDPAGEHSVTFGVGLDASDAIYLSEDIPAPPPPPTGSYIHILNDGEHLLQDIRLFGDEVTWDVAVNAVSGSTHYVMVDDIPDGVLEFYVAARIVVDGVDSYNLPLEDPIFLDSGNTAIQIIFEKIAPLATTLDVRWRLFSLPGPTEDGSPVDLSERGVVTMYGWNANPGVQNYAPVSLTSTVPLPFVSTGYFIFRQPEPDPADSDPNTGVLETTFLSNVNAADAVEVTLQPGWNLVGAPFNGTLATTYNNTPHTVFGFDGANYTLPSVLNMFEGYWVFNELADPATLTVYQGIPTAPAIARREPTPSWVAPLTIAMDSGALKTVELGVEKSAQDGFDALDVPLPPAMPFAGYSEFYAATTDRVGRMSRSVLPARQQTTSWNLVANLAEAGTLRWSAMTLPEGYRLSLESGADRFDLSESGSVRLNQGRRTFVARLTFVPPTATRLMVNYPNPFNPETWIPFELNEGSDVTITVFDMTGNVVRRLDLGYREPGYYSSRDEAAYWDGQNELGERVSSGVYIVEFRAGRTHDLRKITLLK